MQDAVARARALYQRRNFRLAADVLDAYVRSTSFAALPTPARIRALDLLAAALEKLGAAAEARRCAAQMVRLDSRGVLGYLRLGKVLQLAGKRSRLEQAAQVYRRALHKIESMPEKHRQFFHAQIRVCEARAAELAAEERARAKRGDFVRRLPPELLAGIFAQLSLKQRIVCLLVCRAWRDFLASVPAFWTHIGFDAERMPVLACRDVLRYCGLSAGAPGAYSPPVSLDFSHALLKDPASVLEQLARTPALAPRIACLRASTAPVAQPPLLRMLRRASLPTLRMAALRELSILSDTPDLDILWCLGSLPALEELELTTAARHQPPRMHGFDGTPVVATRLRELRLWGQSGSRVLTETLLSDVLALPSLTHVDVHRVTARLWPTFAPVLRNPRMRRVGFTSEGVQHKRELSPFPRFLGHLDSLTLNDVVLSTELPLLVADGRPWQPANPDLRDLKYLELKRTVLLELGLPALLRAWNCADSLETLVVHSATFLAGAAFPAPADPDFCVFARLETLQFTNMRALSDAAFAWIVAAFPNLRRLNLDGTTVTGRKLLGLLRATPVQAVRCKDVADITPDTIVLLKSMPGRTVIF